MASGNVDGIAAGESVTRFHGPSPGKFGNDTVAMFAVRLTSCPVADCPSAVVAVTLDSESSPFPISVSKGAANPPAVRAVARWALVSPVELGAAAPGIAEYAVAGQERVVPSPIVAELVARISSNSPPASIARAVTTQNRADSIEPVGGVSPTRTHRFGPLPIKCIVQSNVESPSNGAPGGTFSSQPQSAPTGPLVTVKLVSTPLVIHWIDVANAVAAETP
jgi:hypothetical protein